MIPRGQTLPQRGPGAAAPPSAGAAPCRGNRCPPRIGLFYNILLFFPFSGDAGGASSEVGACGAARGFLYPHPGAISPSLLAGSHFLFQGSLPAATGGISVLCICFPGGSKPVTFSASFSFFFDRFLLFLQSFFLGEAGAAGYGTRPSQCCQGSPWIRSGFSAPAAPPRGTFWPQGFTCLILAPRGERRGRQRLCLARFQLLLVSPGGISAKKVICKKIVGKY